MKNILIGGDSWGCGEWGWINRKKYGVLHPGLEQYLVDSGFAVVNCSKGASCNKKSIERIAHQADLSDYDHIVWFQSDPLRDLRPYKNFNSMFASYQELLDRSNDLLNSHYRLLNQLDNKVICIGGCSKLNADIGNYENLIPAVASMIELLLPDFSAPNVWHSDWIDIINSSIDENLLDQLVADKKIQDQIGNESIFKPDGFHPNREGHLILFNTIRELLV
jgi:hypothetical protein